MKYPIESRVIFQPSEPVSSKCGKPATVKSELERTDLNGVPLVWIVFDDTHGMSVSVSELKPAPKESGDTV